MDSRDDPTDAGDRLRVPTEHEINQGAGGSERPGDRPTTRETARSLTNQPRTPDALSDNANTDTYFEQFPQMQSSRSRASTRSQNRPPNLRSNSGMGLNREVSNASSSGDRPRSSRQPSIQIRRISNASMRRTTSREGSNIQPFPAFESASDRIGESSHGGRPRSISQPERHAAGYDGMHSRRTPQIALPRLTEEGVRPSLDELGLSGPMSPARSLPEDTQSGPDEEITNSGPWTSRMLKKGGRVLWPVGRKKAATIEGRDSTDLPPLRQDVYDAQLVDYLDTIGKLSIITLHYHRYKMLTGDSSRS